MKRSPSPGFLVALGILISAGAAIPIYQRALGGRSEVAPSAGPDSADLGYGPRPPHIRRLDDFLTPGNMLVCPGIDQPSPRNVLRVELVPATNRAGLAKILSHLHAEVIDTSLGGEWRSVTIVLPGAVDCPARDSALHWLQARPYVRSAGAILVTPRV